MDRDDLGLRYGVERCRRRCGARGSAGDDTSMRRTLLDGSRDLFQIVARRDNDDLVEAPCGETGRERPRDERLATEVREDLVDPGACGAARREDGQDATH